MAYATARRSISPAAIAQALARVREEHPLVQCLTNTVTSGFVANVLLAAGASPAMADVPGEAGPFAAASSAVLVNLGTPRADQREAMREAVEAADAAGTPWVLDPVAVGALPGRVELAEELLHSRPAVIRGNASEVRALATSVRAGRGVDSTHSPEEAETDALRLARRTGAVVAVSGPVDLVTNGDRVIRVGGGDALLTAVTGAGCALGGLVAAFAACTPDSLTAAVAASACYAVAAERAAQHADGPGTFAAALLDELYRLNEAEIEHLARVRA